MSLGLSGLLVLLALSALSLPSQAQPPRPRSSDPRFLIPRIEAARYQQAQQLRPLPQVLVKFRAGVSPEAFARAFSRRANQNPRLRSTVAAHRPALTYMRSLDGLGWHLFRIPSVKALSATLDALRRQPEVLLASPNQAVQLLALGPPSNPKWGVEDVDHTLAAYFGYDPPRNYDSAFWTYSWYLETVNAVAGWDVYPGFYPGAADRIGLLSSDPSRLPLVAVIDTGLDFDHPAFKYPGKANGDTSNGGQIATSLARKIIGGATTSGTANVKDIFGHGTSVAALIAAAPNNGVGLPGLGFVSRLVPIRIYDKVGSNYVGTDADLALAIQYAADAGCLLINVSARTGNTYQPVLQDAVDYAWSHGSLVIAATGNEGSGTTRRWPASLARVLSVGATVYGGEGTFSGEGKADYSNYGPSVTIFAPGGGVTLFNNDAPDTSILGDVVNEFTYLYTAAPTYAVPLASSSTNNPFNETVVDGFYQPSSDPNYGELSGTSFAAPLVTGLAALYAAKNGITQATTDGPQQILQAIQRGADRLPGGLLNGGFTNETAYGRINAASTLQDLNNRNATVGGILGVVKNGAN
ncbi:MAG TPA: S8 family serine peptidase, partial [Chthonomonadaceae bacterium]|nr:S8 family serine peptidase [Chthonomonadaceae bacterium]